MENQFRNDGEMPPEIAAQFLISRCYCSDRKEWTATKRKSAEYSSGVFTARNFLRVAGPVADLLAKAVAVFPEEIKRNVDMTIATFFLVGYPILLLLLIFLLF